MSEVEFGPCPEGDSCKLPNCDGTDLGHDLARDFPAETERVAVAEEELNGGLHDKYRVERRHDPEGKHDACRYFVLDPQHDPIAVMALRYYATQTRRTGLGRDLHDWLDTLADSPPPAPEPRPEPVAWSGNEVLRPKPRDVTEGELACSIASHIGADGFELCVPEPSDWAAARAVLAAFHVTRREDEMP